jgi:TPR repeat protein
MDRKTRQKIGEFIFAALLAEIARGGRFTQAQKRMCRKLTTSLKIDKSTGIEIHRQVLKRVSQESKPQKMSLGRFFSKVRSRLTQELSEDETQKYLRKLANIIGVESRSAALVDPLFDSLKRSRVSETFDHREQAVSSPVNIIEAPSISNRLKNTVPELSHQGFNRILELRLKGDHEGAIAGLLDYSLSLDYATRYVLLARCYFERHNDSEAWKFLEKAKLSGLDEGLYETEKFFLKFHEDSLEENLQRWAFQMRENGGVEEEIEFKSVFLDLVSNLRARFRNSLAVELLEKWGEVESNPDLSKILEELRSQTFVDIYYRYYGRGIMGLQLLASLLVLAVCFYNLGSILPAMQELIISMVSGINDFSSLGKNLQKVLPFVFLVVALIPVVYINALMIWSSYQGRILAYSEVYSDCIKICDFGRFYFLAIKDRKKEVFLYQDDNDYTYISLVRHLPFIPNFTYIYAWDTCRQIYCLLPFYGVADGSLIRKRFLSSKKSKVLPINMLGVRIAQMATVIARMCRTYLLSVPVLCLGAAFFVAYLKFSDQASFMAYLGTLLGFVICLGLFYGFPWIGLRLLRTPILQTPFTANIIKPGLLVLLGAYLFKRYFVYGPSAIIPITVTLYGFYLLFVKTKYAPDRKQIVALVSALKQLPGEDQPFLSLPLGVKALYLGKQAGRFGNRVHLFFNQEYLAISRKFLGMTLYYDVIQITSQFKIRIMSLDEGIQIRVSTYNFDLQEDAISLSKSLKGAGLPHSIESFDEPNRSRIPLRKLTVLASIWFCWQLYIQLGYQGFVPRSESALRPNLMSAMKYLKRGKALMHSVDGMEYVMQMDPNMGTLTLSQKQPMTWMRYEAVIRSQAGGNLLTAQGGEESPIPSFIKVDGFRDDVVDFLSWNFLTRWRLVDSLRYGQAMDFLCESFEAQVISKGGWLACGYKFSLSDAIAFIRLGDTVPEIFGLAEMRELAGMDSRILESLPSRYLQDSELILRAVAEDGLQLRHAPKQLRSNPKLVLKALSQNYRAWRFMDSSLWEHREVVDLLISREGLLLEYVSKRLQADRDIVVKSLSQDHDASKFMHKGFWMDKQICLMILQKDGLALSHIARSLRDDDAIVKTAIQQNGLALEFASSRFRQDASIVLQAVRGDPSASKFMVRSLWRDPDVVKELLAYDGLLLERAPRRLRQDPTLVRIAVEKNFRASHFMDQSFWSHRDIVEAILIQNGMSLEFASLGLRRDPALIKLALQKDGLALQFLPSDLRSDRDLVLRSVKLDGRALEFASEVLKSDPQVFMAAAGNQIKALHFARPKSEWLEKIEKRANHWERTVLGFCYRHGIGVKKDLIKAKSLLLASAEQGATQAQVSLAEIYLNGIGDDQDFREAWKWLEEATEQGSLEALTRMGWMYEQGLNEIKDMKKAWKAYHSAATQGYAEAQFHLARLFLQGQVVGKDLMVAMRWYQKAAEQTYLPAQVELARALFRGTGVSQDLKAALRWRQKAARRGDNDSRVYLGIAYDYGLGVPASRKTAISYYRLARKDRPEMNCLIASPIDPGSKPDGSRSIRDWILQRSQKGVSLHQCILGVYHEEGIQGFPRDLDLALGWYEKSALQNNPEAQVRLGALLETVGKESKDLETAFSWVSKAAEIGYGPGQARLGYLFETGIGVIENLNRAFEWYEKASKTGDLLGQFRLGQCYELGKGVSRDYAEAVNTYRLSAKGGLAFAQTSLATMYEFGKGVKRSDAKALQWYLRAAKQGDKTAIQNLGFMKDRGIKVPDY